MQGQASEHMRNARANIRMATRTCGGADLSRLRRILELLQATAGEMHLAEGALRSGTSNDPVELRREATMLKRETACLLRAIDGCAALHRGLSVRLGCSPLTYTPYGRSAAPVVAAACEMQG